MTLSAQHISKQFQRIRKGKDTNLFTAVQETSLTLTTGKLYVVSGASGSGKSTLLNMLSGLLLPSSGCVTLDDQDIYQLEDKELSRLRGQQLGFLPQGQTALHGLTVEENVLAPYALHGRKSASLEGSETAQTYALNLLEKLGLGELKEEMPSALSGGEIRRMTIARALIRKPAFLFADEPTGDLDEENTKLILQLFRTLTQEGMCIFLVSHDKEAHTYADISYTMEKGVLS